MVIFVFHPNLARYIPFLFVQTHLLIMVGEIKLYTPNKNMMGIWFLLAIDTLSHGSGKSSIHTDLQIRIGA